MLVVWLLISTRYGKINKLCCVLIKSDNSIHSERDLKNFSMGWKALISIFFVICAQVASEGKEYESL